MVGFVKSALNLFGLSHKGTEGAPISIEEFTQDLPKLLGYDIEIKNTKSDEANGEYAFEVQGAEADSFLGNSSDMLDALAHLSMRIIRKSKGIANTPVSEGGESIRVHYDSNGFRESKAEELRELARTQRQKVIDAGGKPAYISALGPSERKVIHTCLADLGDVTSESIGRGNFKRIRVKLSPESPHYRESENRSENRPEASGDGRRSNSGRRGGSSGGGGSARRRGGRGGSNQGAHRNGGAQGFSDGREVNGNRDWNQQDNNNDVVDDNIGNRLAPGEEPLYSFDVEKDQDINEGQNKNKELKD